MKIKIKKTIETETEVELQLPAFFNHRDAEWKILSEKEAYLVRPKIDGREWCYAQKTTGLFAESDIQKTIASGTVSSEENFISAMMTVAHHINKLIQENVPVTVNQDL